jgi:ABC-type iron transport system FetAB ATPase subunit
MLTVKGRFVSPGEAGIWLCQLAYCIENGFELGMHVVDAVLNELKENNNRKDNARGKILLNFNSLQSSQLCHL